jgi:glucose-6-phosphate 1-epimerase
LSAQTGNPDGTVTNPDTLESPSFPDTLAGLPGLALSGSRNTQAFVTQQGAQVISWRDSLGRERLYRSPQTGGYQRGEPAGALYPPIRGGIPVSFPQFSGRGPLPKHGFARNLLWQRVMPDGQPAGANTVTLALQADAQSQGIWPHAFQATLSVAVQAERLRIALAIKNTGQEAWSFTAALHTYLRVDDIHAIALSGLHNLTYQDATAGNAETLQRDTELRITGEVDRVYLAPPDHLVLLEGGKPALRIGQQGFFDTVVWNPGPANARALKDFPDDDWLRMLCVEAACASRPVHLAPGETWQGEQVLTTPSTPA